MRRSFSIFFWILVGAFASGIGIGYFLHQANLDRATLIEQTNKARAEADQIKKQSDQAILDANAKLLITMKEIEQTKKQLEAERKLLTNATKLQKAPPSQQRYWKTILSIPLGISLDLPPGTQGTSTNDLITATIDSLIDGQKNDWLDITAYDTNREQTLLNQLDPKSTSTVAYLADDLLIHGTTGQIYGTASPAFVLRVQKNGNMTHLVWLRARSGLTDQRMLQTLASISVRS